MINQKDNSQTAIIERVTDYEPPRTFRSWLIGRPLSTACLLYTSDAADERSSVDLGGRRIIKNKKQKKKKNTSQTKNVQ